MRILPATAIDFGLSFDYQKSDQRLRMSCGGRPVNRMIRGAAGLAGPLALAAGMLAATAPPAAASAPVNQSYALNAVGHFSAQMIGQATYSGGSPVILPNADAAGVLGTGIITDTAGAVGASSRVQALSVVLPAHGSLHAAAVSSSCSFNRKTGVVTASSSVTGGRLTRPGGEADGPAVQRGTEHPHRRPRRRGHRPEPAVHRAARDADRGSPVDPDAARPPSPEARARDLGPASGPTWPPRRR